MVETANDEANVAYLTLSIEDDLDGARRAAIDDAVLREGGKAVWRTSEAAACSYALVELPDGYDSAALRALSGATAYDTVVIALAVFPAVAQAIPALLDALGGRGRAAGVLRCRACTGGVLVEWDPDVTDARVIIGLIDLELERFGSGRVAELLSPLPDALIAKVAASGLEAPQITQERILELRIDRA
ncbi:MAG TPA: hypothetical protein VIX60_02385 [Candidatus Cybelea sp.]